LLSVIIPVVSLFFHQALVCVLVIEEAM
jgi:hypothetical protein